MYTVVIVGGGAAGFFTAVNLKLPPKSKIIILEKSSKLLAKVKISGGGRCNVTHACFEPKELVKFYPRGAQELIGPFHSFQPGDTFEWFSHRGVELKVEDDNRVFPITDSSQTIIDCFMEEAAKNNVDIRVGEGLGDFVSSTLGKWTITTTKNDEIEADAIVIAVGSSPLMHSFLAEKQIRMIEQVPSLFTFNIEDKRIQALPGVSSRQAIVSIKALKIQSEGPVLITHWGLSGPGILKISAIAARELNKLNYNFKVHVNWASEYDVQSAIEYLKSTRQHNSKKSVHSFCPFDFPIRLWVSLIAQIVNVTLNWADLSNAAIESIAKAVCDCEFNVNGKSTFKDEFVTAGGVDLKEIQFKTMEHKQFDNLYFVGEVLNIDAVTGGFNFQAAWTTSIIAARAISQKAESQKSF